MKIFRFDSEASQAIEKFGSANAGFSRIAHTRAEAHIGCMHLGADGLAGYHQAVASQLFLMVHGEGWVRDETSERIPIRIGQAAFWEKDEWHESGTATGLIAIVIESEFLDPAEFMLLETPRSM